MKTVFENNLRGLYQLLLEELTRTGPRQTPKVASRSFHEESRPGTSTSYPSLFAKRRVVPVEGRDAFSRAGRYWPHTHSRRFGLEIARVLARRK